jgi:hypothetical protein
MTTVVPYKSDVIAFLLGTFFGPVGLWYKGRWAAGFAWLIGAFILLFALGPARVFAVPVLCIAQGIHAAVVKPAGHVSS